MELLQKCKHRGKREVTGEWVHGSLVEHPNGTMFIVTYRMRDPEWNKVITRTVGQYTGLKDINGRPIYEGDIVRNGKHVGAVKWMQGKCCFQLSPGGVFLSKSCEVIGQIYDNADLLKGCELCD